MKLLRTTGLLLLAASVTACIHNRTHSAAADGGVEPEEASTEAGVRGPSRVEGETRSIFGGTVKNWVDLSAEGTVTKFSWLMPLATVSGVPDTTTSDFLQTIGVPDVLTKQTFIQGLDYAFLPKGHSPPGVYDIPHWEWHVFASSQAVFEGIDCSDQTIPAQDDLPPNYIYQPYPFVLVCAPHQGGVHVYDQTSAEFNKQKFTRAFALTVYAGSFASIEPKVTRDVLLARQSFTSPVPVMKTLRRTTPTLYPSTFSATYDQATDSYTVTLSDFRAVQ